MTTAVDLRDYVPISVDVKKSITDIYLQLSASFKTSSVPAKNTTIDHFAYDSSGTKHLLFHGEVINNSPVYENPNVSIEMDAADNSINLSNQYVPWNDRVIASSSNSSSDTYVKIWSTWIKKFLEYSSTGVVTGNVSDISRYVKQFVFDPTTSRYEAITKLADYCDMAVHTKIIPYSDTYQTVFHAVSAADIDRSSGGFDLPDPETFTWPDTSFVDPPKIEYTQDENYNKVTVYGTNSSTEKTLVASAYTPDVYYGSEYAKECVIEDNYIYEKGSSAEIEAIKWLLYYSSNRATVSAKFINKFDLELYQRVRFGDGFPSEFQALTDANQLEFVVACDPRTESTTTHTVNVSGVPTPSWLRISEISYHSEHLLETCEIKAVTDFIYSHQDPTVDMPYSLYLSPGYYKPVSDDTVSSIKAIVSNAVKKQKSSEKCTVKSVSGSTAIVETTSGKLISVKLRT